MSEAVEAAKEIDWTQPLEVIGSAQFSNETHPVEHVLEAGGERVVRFDNGYGPCLARYHESKLWWLNGLGCAWRVRNAPSPIPQSDPANPCPIEGVRLWTTAGSELGDFVKLRVWFTVDKAATKRQQTCGYAEAKGLVEAGFASSDWKEVTNHPDAAWVYSEPVRSKVIAKRDEIRNARPLPPSQGVAVAEKEDILSAVERISVLKTRQLLLKRLNYETAANVAREFGLTSSPSESVKADTEPGAYTAETWPKGEVWIRSIHTPECRELVVGVYGNGIVLATLAERLQSWTFERLVEARREMSTDGGGTWRACTAGSKYPNEPGEQHGTNNLSP